MDASSLLGKSWRSFLFILFISSCILYLIHILKSYIYFCEEKKPINGLGDGDQSVAYISHKL